MNSDKILFPKLISSARLLMRPAELPDAAAYYKLIKNNYARLKEAFPKTIAASVSEEAALNYIRQLQWEWDNKNIFHFLVFLNQVPIGMFFIKSIEWRIPKCELAYFISEEHEGKGFVKEGLMAVMKYCLDELEMNKIFIRSAVTNPASAAVALACGFRKEGTLRSDFRAGTGELQDVDYFGLVKEKQK